LLGNQACLAGKGRQAFLVVMAKMAAEVMLVLLDLLVHQDHQVWMDLMVVLEVQAGRVRQELLVSMEKMVMLGHLEKQVQKARKVYLVFLVCQASMEKQVKTVTAI